MALVISSLRMSSAVKVTSPRPHAESCAEPARRTRDTSEGSGNTSHSAIRSAGSRRVSAINRAMSSLGDGNSSAASTSEQA